MLLNIVILIYENHPLFPMRAIYSYPGPTFHDDAKNDNKWNFQRAEYYNWKLHTHQHLNKAKDVPAFSKYKQMRFSASYKIPWGWQKICKKKIRTKMGFWRKWENLEENEEFWTKPGLVSTSSNYTSNRTIFFSPSWS